MQIKVQLTKEYREKTFVETGNVLSVEQVIELDDNELTKETRAMLVEMDYVPEGNRALDFTRLGSSYSPIGAARNVSYAVDGMPNDPNTFIAEFYAARQAHKAEQDRKREEKRQKADEQLRQDIREARECLNQGDFSNYRVPVSDYASDELKDEARALEQEIKTALKAKREENERKLTEAREAARQEKQRWIAENGSEFLIKAHQAGYDCQRRYVSERAAIEYPGYRVDFDQRAHWNDRACPSEQALEQALEDEANVVWLVAPPYRIDPEEDPYYFESEWEDREALVIDDYLDKYTLIKEL